MWEYNYNYSDELYHYGVKGMKWGRRKARPTSAVYNNMRRAKGAYKDAKKQYNKDFNDAYNRNNIFTKKGRAASNARWEKAMKSGEVSDKAKVAYKSAKKDYKKARADAYTKIQKSTTLAENFMYNEGTRRKAATYVAKHNMSISAAKEKAQGEAMRNTGILLAAGGAAVIAATVKRYG